MHVGDIMDADNQEGSVGLVVNTKEGAANPFDPTTDEAEWMWRRQFHKAFFTESGVSEIFHEFLDLKARRKLDFQSQIQMTFERQGVGLTDAKLSFQLRILFALP